MSFIAPIVPESKSSNTASVMVMPTSEASPVAPPAMAHKLFKETHPTVTVKDKSIHSQHGVVHYPFYFGGLASALSSCCTQPLGVSE